jgi:hypothetical protein
MVILAIPLLAVGIATASQAASQVHLSSNARHLQALVADVADVDLARRRVEAEVMPSLAAVVSATGPVSSLWPSDRPANSRAVCRRCGRQLTARSRRLCHHCRHLRLRRNSPKYEHIC